jgi:uncharacterized protein YqgV (UPF0045/DUF77 family)
MITAEISIVPVGTGSGTSMSKEIALAFDAHEAVKSSGTQRIISIVHIDERLDKEQNLDQKVDSVMDKLQ